MQYRFLSLLATAALVVASCGGDDTDDAFATATTAVTTAAEPTTTFPPTTPAPTTAAPTTAPPTTQPAPLEVDESAVEAAMDSFLAETGSPGVLVGVQVGDAAPVLLARGIDEVATASPMQTDRVFRIGSVTKPVLAALVFDAVEAGRISLDDRLGDFVDGATNPDATIAQLLAHDGGLADWDALEGGINGLLIPNLSRNWAPTEVVEQVKALPPVSEPGNGFSYSNPGYQMLGAIVEQVNGEPIAASVERVLGDGAGLGDIRFGPLTEVPETLIHGYGDLGGNLIDNQTLDSTGIDSLFSTTGAGYSDLDDLLAFSRLYWSAEQALSPAGVDVADDVSGNYGLATQIIDDSFVGHSGDIFGARTLAGHDRELDVTVVVHANTNTLGRQETVDLAIAARAAVG